MFNCSPFDIFARFYLTWKIRHQQILEIRCELPILIEDKISCRDNHFVTSQTVFLLFFVNIFWDYILNGFAHDDLSIYRSSKKVISPQFMYYIQWSSKSILSSCTPIQYFVICKTNNFNSQIILQIFNWLLIFIASPSIKHIWYMLIMYLFAIKIGRQTQQSQVLCEPSISLQLSMIDKCVSWHVCNDKIYKFQTVQMLFIH